MKVPFQTKPSTFLSVAIATALSVPCAARADEPELAPVIVTADRMARSADETLVPVTVVTRADIEREQARSLEDVLRGLPGVALSNNGGPGKSTSLFLRGTNSDHLLVLIDGVKMGSATLGAVALQDIPVDQIERIEIVRGPRASLYGSEAIGGVIQIFTRKGGGKLTPSFSLGAGSRSTANFSANLSGGGDSSWFNAGVAGNSTKGINAYQGNEPDRDGYRNQSANLRGGWRFSPGHSLELQLLRVDAHNDFDGTYLNQSDTAQQLVSATYRFAPAERWHSHVLLAQSRDDDKDYENGNFVSSFNTTRDMATWQNDIDLATGHALSVGLDSMRDHVDSNTDYARTSRDNKAVFAQYSGEFGAFSTQLAARADDNQQFGHHNSGSLGVGYRVADDLRLRASYGTAFKAPSFNELYYPYSGNPDLAPEKSRSKEVGASGKLVGVDWNLSLFRTDLSNAIEWIEQPAGVWNPYNIDSRITGLEADGSWHIGDTRMSASFTAQDSEYRIPVVAGNQLARRPKLSGKIEADHDFGRWSFGSTLNGVGRRYDNAANTTKLGGYATLDLRGEYRIDADWRVQARIENLFDKHYETVARYNQPGFGTFLTLRYQPK